MVNFVAVMAAAMPAQKIGINVVGCCCNSHIARTCHSSLSQLLLRQCFPSIAAAAPSHCSSYAYLLPKMVLFSSLSADTFQPPATIFPQWRRYTPKTDFFATISRNHVSKIRLSRHALHFFPFLLITFTFLSLLSTQNSVLLLLV
jgi:hypothetical protein